MSLNLLTNNSLNHLVTLDWNLLTANIYKEAYFEKTKTSISTPPVPQKTKRLIFEYDALDFFLDNLDEFVDLIHKNFCTLSDEQNFTKIIKSFHKGHILTIEEINSTCKLFECYSAIKKSFFKLKAVNHLFPEQKIYNQILNTFSRPVRQIIKPDGDINYDGHPDLKKYYNELKNIENSLRQDMQKMSKSDLYKDSLQFSQFDIVGDHYVLAVKSDCYTYEHGPIIDKSSSGQTLFVEPFELRNKCDKRLRLLAMIDEVLSKLCTKYSEVLGLFSKDFEDILEAIHKIDLIHCKAKYSYDKNLVRPEISKDFQIELINFFHPLIESPVTNTVKIESHKSGLIISGPNTGGKTVGLKSLAIAHLYLHMGLFIPATSAKLSPITNLYFLANEGQDLSQGLSSFALESKNYLEIMETLGETNLVIIDEIFNSTSSEEASALAISLFEEITKISNTKFLVSTHHQLLKTSIHKNDNFLSAHVGFDLETNLPTYKLYTDGPGSSLAFTIFENLSQKFSTQNSISQNAKKILNKKQISYDELLQELSTKKTDLDRLLQENRNLNHELKNQKKSMDGILFLEKEESHRYYKKKLADLLQKAEDLLFEVKSDDRPSKKSFYNKKSIINSDLQKEKIENSQKEKTLRPTGLIPVTISDIKIGQKLYCESLKKEVVATKVNLKKKQVHIKAGALGLWTPIESLFIHHSLVKKEKNITIHVQKGQDLKLEHDCRGMRLDEFQKLAENCFSDLITGNIPFATLIHGHGSGVLKSWLRKTLSQNFKEIQWEAPDGNDGITQLKLKPN